jgi:DNA-binding MarR family transcriptional regulator
VAALNQTPPDAHAGPPPDPAPIEFYRSGDYAPEASIGYLMRRVLVLVTQAVEQQLGPSDLTNAQWLPLYRLHMGHASTVAELARECHLDGGAMTRLLDRLESKGLVRRVRSQSDRRVVNIELSPEGQLAAQGIPDILSRVQNAHLAGFSQEEFDLLKHFLNRILTNAQAQAQTPLFPVSSDSAPLPSDRGA